MPELILALKYVVDRDTRPGQFLLTGSANLLRLPTIEDSLAGRTERIELHSFSQGELAGRVEHFVDRLLAGETFANHRSQLHRHDYLNRATAGGYPEALSRTEGRRRDLWLDNYTSAPYLELLQTLYLTQHLPAWATNLSKRAISRPKVSLLDTGVAARLNNVSALGASLAVNPNSAGGLLEGLVAGELRRQLSWNNESARLCHFRNPRSPGRSNRRRAHGRTLVDLIEPQLYAAH